MPEPLPVTSLCGPHKKLVYQARPGVQTSSMHMSCSMCHQMTGGSAVCTRLTEAIQEVILTRVSWRRVIDGLHDAGRVGRQHALRIGTHGARAGSVVPQPQTHGLHAADHRCEQQILPKACRRTLVGLRQQELQTHASRCYASQHSGANSTMAQATEGTQFEVCIVTVGPPKRLFQQWTHEISLLHVAQQARA